MNYTAKELVAVAAGEVGYCEKTSNAKLDEKTANSGSNNYTKYARDLYAAGYYNGNKNGFAWCDVFVDWCHYVAAGRNRAEAEKAIYQSGTKLGAGCTYSAQYYKNANAWYSSPNVGDQIFFGARGAESHTGIVEKVEDGRVHTIEGNTSANKVERKSYALNYSRISGYGRPKYAAAPVAQQTKKKETVAYYAVSYAVKKGDTLSKIANKYSTTVSKIAQANDIANVNLINVGQVLYIPDATMYIVVKGDTLSKIARAKGSTVEKIVKANGIINANLIRVGQKLIIP